MPFLLIKGTFHPATGVPDGDTVRFAADNTDLLFRLEQRGRPPRLNGGNGTIALRYEGIDAMERDARQPESSDATAANLSFLGLSGPNDEGRGYIFSRQVDPNGRPICFVFSGDTDEMDGESVFVSADRIGASINVQLLNAGHVYPLFYDTLFADLREEMTRIYQLARERRLGVWREDGTNAGVSWGGIGSLDVMPPFFPKLWRRLEGYTFDREFRDSSDTLDEFDDYLRFRDDRLFILPDNRFTGLDNVVAIDRDQLRLTVPPEILVFQS